MYYTRKQLKPLKKAICALLQNTTCGNKTRGGFRKKEKVKWKNEKPKVTEGTKHSGPPLACYNI